jgi:hypothetical protein
MDAIARYKSYQKKYLPNVRNIEGLYAPDFDSEAYPGDALDALGQYLEDLTRYTTHICTAAQLRQEHYEQYVVQEDPGHKVWREGMNEVAIDCQSKLEYWTRVYDSRWNAAVMAQERKIENMNLTAKNCEYSPVEADVREVVRPPKISARARTVRRNEYRNKLLAERKASENALIDSAMQENRAYYDLVEQYSTFKKSNAVNIPVSDVRDQILVGGIAGVLAYLLSVEGKYGLATIVGDHTEIIELAEIIIVEMIREHTKLCTEHGCTIVHKCNRGADTPRSCAEFLLAFKIITQSGPCDSVVYTSVLNEIRVNDLLNIDSTLTLEILGMMVGRMTDNTFIEYYRSIVRGVTQMKAKISAMIRMQENTREQIDTIMAYYKRMLNIQKRIVELYPTAKYYCHIELMTAAIKGSHVVYYSKLTIAGTLLIDPPKIDFRKIQREIGIEFENSEYLVKRYNEVRAQFDAILRAELKQLVRRK